MNIILLGKLYKLILTLFLIIITNIFYSITRDNASPNNTLINAFRSYYLAIGIKFTRDILCLVHVLNIVVQDILKTLIKDAYSDFDNQNIFNIENNEDIIEENSNSKFLID